MKQRVYGLETEYAIAFETGNRQMRSGDPGTVYDRLERALLASYRVLESDSFGRDPSHRTDEMNMRIREGHFLESGARFYYDTGHVEWATPEARTAEEAVLYELAGQHTLVEMAATVPLPHGGRYMFIKNNVDYVHGTTYGCHENYLVPRQPNKSFFDQLTRQMVPFLVTRQIFCGAGKVGSANTKNTRPVGYQISQRADFIESITSQETRSERAIINIRDESLSDDRYYRRLHLIVGDSNMSAYANILKLGVTGIILQLIEANVLEDTPVLADPVGAIKAVSCDLTCQQPLWLENGRQQTPIEIQRYYLHQAHRFYQTHPPDTATQKILTMWRQVLDDLAMDPMGLADRIDWVIKLRYLLKPQLDQAGTSWRKVASWSHLIETLRHEGHTGQQSLPGEVYARYQFYVNEHDLHWGDYNSQYRLYYSLRERDLRYHDIDPLKSLFYTLQEAHMVKTVFGASQIKAAQQQPPDTRAQIRAEVIRWAYKTDKMKTMLDWGRVEFTDPRLRVMLNDPLATTNQEISGRLHPQLHQVPPPLPGTPGEDEMDIRVLGVEETPNDGGIKQLAKKLWNLLTGRGKIKDK